ncbi:hypothetical protein ACHHYP_20118 [Achlya hypogyna]|uniref:Uncharacterized protein n=1 Tax=Achlya hypogyna TaxID=1202772 RepID=A0A1V9Z4F8_ACHHY|nr:hypothetical protein ACHHYP_20118 [Achlya hypogyna]
MLHCAAALGQLEKVRLLLTAHCFDANAVETTPSPGARRCMKPLKVGTWPSWNCFSNSKPTRYSNLAVVKALASHDARLATLHGKTPRDVAGRPSIAA